MGGATNICSDKTGTLTMNQMTVQAGWMGGQEFSRLPWEGEGVAPGPAFYEILRSGVALNATAHRQIDPETSQPKVIGMPTEMALMDLIDVQEGRKEVSERGEKKGRDARLTVLDRCPGTMTSCARTGRCCGCCSCHTTRPTST